MRVVIIGGTGHIGSYLTPRLVEAGHQVVSVSRGKRQPYVEHRAWDAVEQVSIDRQAEEEAGSFGKTIQSLRADAVVDLTCYTEQSAQQMVEALRGDVQQFLHCGTIWIHGPGVERPTTEAQARQPISDYGRRKLEIEHYLLAEARKNRFPVTILHPGHLVGRGWMPLNPAAHFNPQVFTRLMRGEEVALPSLGMETLHHVHADDVAQAFERAIENWSSSVGESFHVVSPAAITMRGYAEAVAGWFGEQANLRFVPWEEWRTTVSEKEAAVTWDHIARSPNCSIAKAERLLQYRPRYRSLNAIHESVMWLVDQRMLEV